MNAQPHILQQADEDMEDFEAVLDLPHPPEDRSDKAALDAYLDYLLERIGTIDQQKATNDAVYQRRVQMLADWRDGENAMLLRRREYLVEAFRALTAQYEYPKGKKSRTLPNGTFGTRSAREKLDIVDPQKAIDFARAYGVPVRVKEEVDAKALREFYESTGTVPLGCSVVPAEDKWYVKPTVEGA